ncbi:MAG TPA: hypothetical protein VM096_02670 [Vicinamibacterales bacterium]|nr:hypothetical protein [Vicinamibacterales bacterium]
MPADSENVQQLDQSHLRSRWDAVVWPKWLPVQARLPLIAQITGAVALTALLAAPWWSSIPDNAGETDASGVAHPATVAPAPSSGAGGVETAPPVATPSTPAEALRPAHLNLDVRHSFANVRFSVSVDGKSALDAMLEGSDKRFKVFGKRSERSYTKTLDLPPGVRVVRVRVLSADDKFDQTRVVGFELGSASVATLRVSADKSGLSLVAERPPAPKTTTVPAPVQTATVLPPPPAVVPTAATTVPAAGGAAPRTSQEANAVLDLLQSVRSLLIAIAGFVASAATGFVVQEYLRSRKGLLFAGAPAEQEASFPNERRRRRRPGRARIARENAESGDGAPASDSDVRAAGDSSVASE